MEKVSDEPIFKGSKLLNGSLKGYFVVENVFNLPYCKLSKGNLSVEVCSRPNTIEKSILKEDLENLVGRWRVVSRLNWRTSNLPTKKKNLSKKLIFCQKNYIFVKQLIFWAKPGKYARLRLLLTTLAHLRGSSNIFYIFQKRNFLNEEKPLHLLCCFKKNILILSLKTNFSTCLKKILKKLCLPGN